MSKTKTKIKITAKATRLALRAAFKLGALFGSKKAKRNLLKQNNRR